LALMRGLVAGIAGAILGTATSVSAHSLLLEARPAANTAVAAPPRVTLRFNNRVEKRLSRVTIVDAGHVRHDLALVAAEGASDTLTMLAPPLAPGPYRVEWQVLSADGHVVSGRYGFRVVP
jgi:methionine-rich copper-binding protein CopC